MVSLAVLIITRVSIMADFSHFGHKYGLVINTVFAGSSFDMGMF